MTKKTKVLILSILNVSLIILIGYLYRWRFSITTLVDDYCKAFNSKDCYISAVINDDLRHKLVVIETDSYYSSITVESLGFIHRQVNSGYNINLPFVDSTIYTNQLGLPWFPKDENFLIQSALPNTNKISFYQSDDSYPKLVDVVFETEKGVSPLIKKNPVQASRNDEHIFTYNTEKRYVSQDKNLLYYPSKEVDRSLELFDLSQFLPDGAYVEVLDPEGNILKHHFIESDYTEENEKLRLLSSLHILIGSIENVDVNFFKENYDFTIISKEYKYTEDSLDNYHELEDFAYNKYYFKAIEGGAIIIDTHINNGTEYNNQVLGITDSEYKILKETIGIISE